MNNDDLFYQRASNNNNSGNLLNNLIKILIIILLLVGIFLLGVYTYKSLLVKSTQVQVSKNTVSSINAEQIATITKSIITQIKQDSTNKSIPTDKNNALYTKLMKSSVDTLDDRKLDLTATNATISADEKNSTTNKQIDDFNKVIVTPKLSKNNISQVYKKFNKVVQERESTAIENSSYSKNIKKEVKTRKNAMRIITVKRGDTLSSLAQKAYGKASAYNKIFAANPDLIKNKDKIFIGQKLRVPK